MGRVGVGIGAEREREREGDEGEASQQNLPAAPSRERLPAENSHVQPSVGQPLSLLDVAVAFEAAPGEHLMGRLEIGRCAGAVAGGEDRDVISRTEIRSVDASSSADCLSAFSCVERPTQAAG